MAACPRQDPDEDPFTRVNVTHRASRTHCRPQSKTERDVVSNSTLLVKTKLSSPVLENRDKRVVASVTGAKRRQLTETAVRYSKVAMAVLHLLHELPNVRSWARLFFWKLAHPFLPTASVWK